MELSARTASLRLHRAKRDDALEHRRLLETPQHRSVLRARSFQVELKTNMLPGHRYLDVLHHRMDAFQNLIDLRIDRVGAAAGYFIGMYRQLQIEPLFRTAQQK